MTGIAREWSLSTNCEFTTMIPKSNVKIRCNCEKGNENIRNFGRRNRWGKSNRWHFLNVVGWLIDTSVPSRELTANITQQSSSNQLLVHIRGKHPELVKNWIFDQDNECSDEAYCVTEFLEEHNIKVMEHPPTIWTLPRATSGCYLPWRKAWEGCNFALIENYSERYEPSLTVSSSPNFVKLLRINSQNAHRNAF